MKLNLQRITCNLSFFVIIVSLLSSSPSPNLTKKITKKCNARQKSFKIPTTDAHETKKTQLNQVCWAYKELTKKLKKMIKNVTNKFIQWNGTKVSSMNELYHQSSTLFDFYQLKTSSKEVGLKMCEQLSSLFIIDFTFDLDFKGTSRGTHTHLISHCKCCISSSILSRFSRNNRNICFYWRKKNIETSITKSCCWALVNRNITNTLRVCAVWW